jgi:hypothetical protein
MAHKSALDCAHKSALDCAHKSALDCAHKSALECARWEARWNARWHRVLCGFLGMDVNSLPFDYSTKVRYMCTVAETLMLGAIGTWCFWGFGGDASGSSDIDTIPPLML